MLLNFAIVVLGQSASANACVFAAAAATNVAKIKQFVF
jgi:hypothetical protein